MFLTRYMGTVDSSHSKRGIKIVKSFKTTTYGGLVMMYQYKPPFVGVAKMARKVTFSCSHTRIFAAEQEFFGWLDLTGLHRYVVLALRSRHERTIRIGKRDCPGLSFNFKAPSRPLGFLPFQNCCGCYTRFCVLHRVFVSRIRRGA